MGYGIKQRRRIPKKKWLHSVKEDIILLKIHDWKEKIKDRRKWKELAKIYFERFRPQISDLVSGSTIMFI